MFELFKICPIFIFQGRDGSFSLNLNLQFLCELGVVLMVFLVGVH